MKPCSWRRWQRILIITLHLWAVTSFHFRIPYGIESAHRDGRGLATTQRRGLGHARWYKKGDKNKILLSPTQISTTILGSNPMDDLDTFSSGLSSVVPLLVVFALGLGLAAQGWINQQLQGDQGLGAFLKDGQGYKRSGFRPLSDGDRAASNDPLPWLSLPKLDFVDVAGQESSSSLEDALLIELEDLRMEMNQQLELGNAAEANAIRIKLESRMRESGFEFQTDE